MKSGCSLVPRITANFKMLLLRIIAINYQTSFERSRWEINFKFSPANKTFIPRRDGLGINKRTIPPIPSPLVSVSMTIIFHRQKHRLNRQKIRGRIHDLQRNRNSMAAPYFKRREDRRRKSNKPCGWNERSTKEIYIYIYRTKLKASNSKKITIFHLFSYYFSTFYSFSFPFSQTSDSRGENRPPSTRGIK